MVLVGCFSHRRADDLRLVGVPGHVPDAALVALQLLHHLAGQGVVDCGKEKRRRRS